jgi:hypothetical protein
MPDDLFSGQEAEDIFQRTYGRPIRPGERGPKPGAPLAQQVPGAANASSPARARMSGRYSGKIRGLREVEANLRKLAKRMKMNVRPAMVEVVTLIQRESMERTPIRTGFLRASHRSRVIGRGVKTVGTIFVTASYALFVHEASPATRFRSPWPRGRKFLERAVTDNLAQLIGIIRNWLTVRP